MSVDNRMRIKKLVKLYTGNVNMYSMSFVLVFILYFSVKSIKILQGR